MYYNEHINDDPINHANFVYLYKITMNQKEDIKLEIQKDYIPVFKALADETRLKIVEMLSCGEMCACDILESFQITQPTLSYHMKILTESGLVNSRKDGSWIRYSNNTELTASLIEFLKQITTEHANCICKRIVENNKC